MPNHLIQLNQQLVKAWPTSPFTGQIKLSPQDFFVEEELGFTPSGNGNHLFLFIEKQATNTNFLAQHLARQFNLPVKEIGFSGLKDRHALTRQWFSLPWAANKNLPNVTEINTENWQVLNLTRHNKKLKRGTHKANIFKLKIKIDNPSPEAASWFKERWQLISSQGVPNYFGLQRFGRNYQNISGAINWLLPNPANLTKQAAPKRQAKSMYLSALRSALFNVFVSQQVAAGTWLAASLGRRYNLNASNSFFTDPSATNLAQRVETGDLHPAAPLAGRGELATQGEALELEEKFRKEFEIYWQALANQGLKAEYKAMRLLPEPLEFNWQAPYLTLGFKLPTGCFATSVVAELLSNSV